jgi:hypothetical protein
VPDAYIFNTHISYMRAQYYNKRDRSEAEQIRLGESSVKIKKNN